MPPFHSVMFRIVFATLLLSLVAVPSQRAHAQGYGVELHNTVKPASGGMGGTSIAEPQDVLSAINTNPAALTQFRGTNFTFGGSWIGPTVNMRHTGNGLLPGIGPFEGRSGTPGASLANIGISQDFRAMGRPVTLGVSLISLAGLGVDYSAQANAGNSALTLQILSLQPALGVQLTDRLSVGANFGVGIGLFDGLFVGNSKATPAYGARGTVGLNYDINPQTKFGFSYQTREEFKFENAIVLRPFVGLPGLPIDIEAELPTNIALGFSNSSLANGRLLLAGDVVYKLWEDAKLFRALYRNQLVVQLGAQYTTPRAKFRCGYAWSDDAMADAGNVISGITPPGASNAIEYIQAIAPNINPHRISAGVGIPDVLPGIDLDVFCGGMLRGSATFGASSANVESYYIGGGLTWRFRRGSGCKIAPDQWCVAAE